MRSYLDYLIGVGFVVLSSVGAHPRAQRMAPTDERTKEAGATRQRTQQNGPSGIIVGNVKMERGLDFSRHRSGVQRVWLANGGLAVLATPGKTESGSAGTQSGEGYSGRRCAKGATGARQHLAAVGF